MDTKVLLSIEMPDGSVEEFPIQVQGPVVIGRDPSSHVVLPSPEVSRRHLIVEPSTHGFKLTDQSANGTLINNQHVKRSKVDTPPNVHLRIGPCLVHLRRINDPPPPTLPPAGHPGGPQLSSADHPLATFVQQLGSSYLSMLASVPDRETLIASLRPGFVIRTFETEIATFLAENPGLMRRRSRRAWRLWLARSKTDLVRRSGTTWAALDEFMRTGRWTRLSQAAASDDAMALIETGASIGNLVDHPIVGIAVGIFASLWAADVDHEERVTCLLKSMDQQFAAWWHNAWLDFRRTVGPALRRDLSPPSTWERLSPWLAGVAVIGISAAVIHAGLEYWPRATDPATQPQSIVQSVPPLGVEGPWVDASGVRFEANWSARGVVLRRLDNADEPAVVAELLLVAPHAGDPPDSELRRFSVHQRLLPDLPSSFAWTPEARANCVRISDVHESQPLTAELTTRGLRLDVVRVQAHPRNLKKRRGRLHSCHAIENLVPTRTELRLTRSTPK